MRRLYISIVVFFTLLALPQQGATDELFNDDVIISGRLCVGPSCSNGEGWLSGIVPYAGQIKLDSTSNAIWANDTSNPNLGPTRDWALLFNAQALGGIEAFRVHDDTEGTFPFSVIGRAPNSSLVVGENGFVGLGTTLPQSHIHIMSNQTPAIRFEPTSQSSRRWMLGGSVNAFFVQDGEGGPVPFWIAADAPRNSIRVEADGYVGVGTPFPDGKLHVEDDGVVLTYIESGDGGPVQLRLRSDNENRRFLAVNNANQVQTQIIFADNEIRFTGQTDSGANRWLTIGPTGIVSQGPTCNPGPCDATFDPEQFEVPPLKERTAYMWENQHLWAVGPTKPGEPINLTEKTGAMLHELEVAYIYIEQLHDRLEAQALSEARQNELIAELSARLEVLEAE